MKSKNVLTIIALIAMVSNAIKVQSQNYLYFGLDGGLCKNITQVYSGENTLRDKFTKEPDINSFKIIYGLNLGYELKNNIAIEIGLYKSGYSNYFVINDGKNESFYSMQEYNIYSIPVNIKYRINIYKNKLLLCQSAGVSFVSFQKKPGFAYSLQTDTFPNSNNPETKTMLETIGKQMSNTYFVCHAGLGIDYNVFTNTWLLLKADYSMGFNSVFTYDIKYRFNYDNRERTGSLLFKGNNYTVSLGIRYVFPASFK